ncbi:MAG: ABC transporter substrate-binding protein [Oscillospiraceae bacterium]
MKKTVALLLTFAMTSCIFAGCTSKAPKSSEAPKASETPDLASTETREIVDALGRKVEIPAVVNTIVPLGNTPRMVSYLGLADKVVGIGECEKADSPIKAYAYVCTEAWANLPNVGTDAMGETAYYPEVILEANPDVILCTYAKDVVEDIAKQTGIPVISVSQGTLFAKDYEDSLRTLGEVCGVSERAEKLIGFINECLADLSKRTADIPNESKPTVLAAAATFSGSHGIEGVYSNYPVFKTIAANDLAVGVSEKVGGVMVDKEKIVEWNPDMIFLDYSGLELVKADYAQNPKFYAQLKAVSSGNVYTWPNSTWHWSNVEMPLVSAYYTAKLLYPDEFADVDFEAKASEIFEMFLGKPDFLNVLKEAGAGYGKVALGE